MLKMPLVFGLATGLLVFGFFLGLYFMNIVPLGNNKILDFGIHVIMMAGACWYYRKVIGKGFLHLWEALTICYIVNTVASFIAGWLMYLFITYVDPTIFTRYLAEMATLLEAGKVELVKNIGEAEYAKMYASIQEMDKSEIITDEISKKTVMAIIPILIISLLLRRQDHAFLRDRT